MFGGVIWNLLYLFQVLNLVERKSGSCDHVIFDTPGQIEVFTW
jgi:hypothetical protein